MYILSQIKTNKKRNKLFRYFVITAKYLTFDAASLNTIYTVPVTSTVGRVDHVPFPLSNSVYSGIVD